MDFSGVMRNGGSAMGTKGAKLCIEKELLNVQLNLENNYKENAYDAYLNVKAMIESFFEQGEISKWAYKRYIRKLKKYDEIYAEDEENPENEENPEDKKDIS